MLLSSIKTLSLSEFHKLLKLQDSKQVLIGYNALDKILSQKYSKGLILCFDSLFKII